jgi:hypothetical protein
VTGITVTVHSFSGITVTDYGDSALIFRITVTVHSFSGNAAPPHALALVMLRMAVRSLRDVSPRSARLAASRSLFA